MSDPKVADIQTVVAGHFGIPLIDMRSCRLGRAIARPRQIAMYLARILTPLSLPAIGARFSKDHTTVMRAVEHITELCERDQAFAAEVAMIRQRIENPGQLQIAL